MNETVYKLQLPSSDRQMVDSTITILADWAGHLLLDSLEIEKERGVILSERLSRTGPESEIGEAFLMEIFERFALFETKNNWRYSSYPAF